MTPGQRCGERRLPESAAPALTAVLEHRGTRWFARRDLLRGGAAREHVVTHCLVECAQERRDVFLNVVLRIVGRSTPPRRSSGTRRSRPRRARSPHRSPGSPRPLGRVLDAHDRAVGVTRPRPDGVSVAAFFRHACAFGGLSGVSGAHVLHRRYRPTAASSSSVMEASQYQRSVPSFGRMSASPSS